MYLRLLSLHTLQSYRYGVEVGDRYDLHLILSHLAAVSLDLAS